MPTDKCICDRCDIVDVTYNILYAAVVVVAVVVFVVVVLAVLVVLVLAVLVVFLSLFLFSEGLTALWFGRILHSRLPGLLDALHSALTWPHSQVSPFFCCYPVPLLFFVFVSWRLLPEDGQLNPEALVKACEEKGQPAELRMQVYFFSMVPYIRPYIS